MTHAAQHAAERLERVDAALVEFLPTWSLAPVVEALQALRGVQLVTAATIMVEIGDLRRFDNPRQLMGYLGLVPGERSTGDTVRRLGITKAGNGRVRRALVESAWSYRHVPRISRSSTTCTSVCQRRCGRSRSRPRSVSARATGRSRAAAKS